jgi:hypothetical protein
VLVNGASLVRQLVIPERHQRGFQARSAVDDHELGPFQAAGIEVGEPRDVLQAESQIWRDGPV